MSSTAPKLSWQSPEFSAPVDNAAYRKSGSRIGALVAVAAFLPLWLPTLLSVGNFSFAFAMPFVLAAWALTQPAAPGSFRRALVGTQCRGLWLEAACAALIGILAAFSTIYSPEPLNAFRVILPMAYSLCALTLLCRPSPIGAHRLANAAVFAGVAVLGLALLLSATSAGRLGVMRDYRLIGFFENPNQLGVMIVGVWPPAVAMLLSARGTKARLMGALPVLVLIVAILLSGTKTALALAFVSGGLIWIYHGVRSGSLGAIMVKLPAILVAVVLAVPLMLWVLSWASPSFFARVDDILLNGVWAFPSMQARHELWTTSFAIGLANPLLGEGAGTSILGYAHSHNMLLDYFRGMGVIAACAVVVLILSAAARCAKFLLSTSHKGTVDRQADTLVAGMYLGAMFHLLANQLSDSFSPTTAFLFWILYFGAYFSSQPALSLARFVRPPVNTVAWRPRGLRPGATSVIVQSS